MDSPNAMSVPFFQDVFELVCQLRSSPESHVAPHARATLDMLAVRPTRDHLTSPQSPSLELLARNIPGMTGIGSKASCLGSFRQILPIAIISKIQNVSNVPLRSLNRLIEENNILGQEVAQMTDAFTSNRCEILRNLLSKLHLHLYDVFSMHFQQDGLKRLSECLHGITPGWTVSADVLSMPQGSYNSTTETQFGTIFKSYLMPSLHRLSSATEESPDELKHTAHACISLFMACLLLFVPDQPVDPLVSSAVRVSIWNQQKRALEVKLQALRRFESCGTGQDNNHRCDVLRRKIGELGDEPKHRSPRPKDAPYELFHSELLTILNSIVYRCQAMEATSSPDVQDTRELHLIRLNIVQVIHRLSAGYEVYDDITSPVIGFLQGLNVGISLLIVHESPRSQGDPSYGIHSQEDTNLPLFGTHLIHSATGNTAPSNSASKITLFLRRLSLEKAVTDQLPEFIVEALIRAVHDLYQAWRLRLENDKNEHAAKTSMYHYKASQVDEDISEEKDFQQMFPDALEASPKEKLNESGNATLADPHSITRSTVHLLESLLVAKRYPTDALLEYLQGLVPQVASCRIGTDEMSPIPAESLAPLLFLQLHQVKQDLDSSPSRSNYNFYTDPNIEAVQAFVSLLKRIHSRFRRLQLQWPEHSTLADVLQSVKNLLGLSIKTPIAALMVRLEKLHGFVYEWQAVASREYSASTEYEELTQTIISWRRLELSTWARMLDLEDEKYQEDNKAWFFIAYQASLAVAWNLRDDEAALKQHIGSLLPEMQRFLASASLAQFPTRLDLLDLLHKFCSLAAKSYPGLTPLAHALENLHRFNRRYKLSILGHVQTGRSKIEKDIKQVMLIASWKDSNIHALHESARKSRFKLFKLIKKYRALLAGPAEPLMRAEPTENQEPEPRTLVFFQSLSSRIAGQEKILQSYQSARPGWMARFPNLGDPWTTVERMQQLEGWQGTQFDTAGYISSFSDSVRSRVDAFAKATPDTLTATNKIKVKQLKNLKRRMFADVLRELRVMGIRSNLDAETLERQNQTSKVLAGVRSTDALHATENVWFAVLEKMSGIRRDCRQPSEELTSNEVNRSLGLLEGLLLDLINQRTTLADSLRAFKLLNQALDSLSKLCSQDYSIVPRLHADSTGLISSLNWLDWMSTILSTSCRILETQESLGGLDFSTLVQILRMWSTSICDMKDVFKGLPTMPAGFSTSKHYEADSSMQQLAASYLVEVDKLIDNYPKAAFILRVLRPWLAALDSHTYSPDWWTSTYDLSLTKPDTPAVDLANEGNLSDRQTLQSVESKIFDTLEIIFSTVQRVQEVIKERPQSSKANGWLREIDSCNKGALKHFQEAELGKRILSILNGGNLRYLSEEGLSAMVSLVSSSLPVLDKYRELFLDSIQEYVKEHNAECCMALLLSDTFKSMLHRGFCSPSEKPGDETEPGNLENGVGLGEGEGAEDISKDVKDDEDLTELAEQNEANEDKDELDGGPDAVDMADNALEGEVGKDEGTDKESESGDDRNEDDVEDEIGSVNASDMSEGDQKMEKAETNEGRDGETSGKKQKKDQNEVSANGQTEQAEDANEQELEQDEEEPEGSQEELSAEEANQTAHAENDEARQPEAQDGEPLDLPEDLDMEDFSSSIAEDIDNEMRDASSMNTDDGREEENDSLSKELSNDGDHNEADLEDGEHADDSLEPENEENADDEGPADLESWQNSQNKGAEIDSADSFKENAIGSGGTNEQQDTVDPTDNEFGGQIGQGQRAQQAHEQSISGGNDGELQAGYQESQTTIDKIGASQPTESNNVFQKLGDALEKWRRSNKQILPAQEQDRDLRAESVELYSQDQEYSHLPDVDAQADTQALGPATDEQSQRLDKQARDAEIGDKQEGFLPDAEDSPIEEDPLAENTRLPGQPGESRAIKAGVLIGNQMEDVGAPNADAMDLDENIPEHLSNIHLSSKKLATRPLEDARQLWLHHELATRALSLSLAEQLRLILAPTLKSKMRGDFRTGKRLNIKRIIPYIASGFKRDKIWMRRSIATKRSYQVMLAIDDSKSMGESESGTLAFETLALVSKGLSLLEVGEICVVGFGEDTFVAHPFDQSFSSEAGMRMFQHFTFKQTRTDVLKLLSTSLRLFGDAKAKQHSSGSDLWQLQLIISDGICESHRAIQRLVRQAQEEKIMIIFVIVDSMNASSSILDMTQASFEVESGEPSIKVRKYLESFPFNYYLIVRDIKELPSVLAGALRQWFAEVTES